MQEMETPCGYRAQEGYSSLFEGILSTSEKLQNRERPALQGDRYGGAYISDKGICAMDRAGDRGKVYDKFPGNGKEKRFVIRFIKIRDLLHKGARKNYHLLASIVPCPYETMIIKYDHGKEKKRRPLSFTTRFP
jgi:hypothetical protein